VPFLALLAFPGLAWFPGLLVAEGYELHKLVRAATFTQQPSEQRYYFKFISPKSYNLFFQTPGESKYQDFTSTLEANLERE